MMTEERWKILRERFVVELNKPREDGESPDEHMARVNSWLDAVEMSIAVRELRERLEAVCAIMEDPNAFYGQDVTVKVLRAARGE